MPETLDLNGSDTEKAPRWSLRVSEWPVVRKVALVLAIPLLLAVVLGGLRVQDELEVAGAADAAASQVTVLGPAVAYLYAAEDAALVFRSTSDEQQREAALKRVNDAAADLETAWSSADLSDAQRAQVRQLLDETQGLRDGSAYTIVSTASQELQDLEAQVTLGIAGMTDAGSGTEALIGVVGHLNAGRLAVVRQQQLVVVDPAVIPKEELYGFLGVESAAIANLELLLPDDKQVDLLRQYNASNAGLLGIGTPDLKGQAPLKLYDQLATGVLDRIETGLASQATASNRTALVTAVLTGLALLLAIVLGLIVSRLLVRPIRQVRDNALAVAHEELPETVRRIRAGQDPGTVSTIPVTTHEEMGQLARAVDDLHETAVRLAQDEAELRSRVGDMFVTLSRRNTSLVNQQLRLIEKLETDEEDPQRLESLFRLDHLASRMRRTAESLVVLADAPTQASEQDALSVDEALQAALAGVQEYQRVQVSGAPSLRVTGTAAADLVHLFTELVDNALAFSPPTSQVVITSTTPAGMVLVEVADRGLGIDTATLADLNQTLRTGAEITADTTRRMGLFVVARLARRHGLTVSLERNAEGGTTARVFIPRPLLTGTAGDPDQGVDVETPLATVTPVTAAAIEEPAVVVEQEPEVVVEDEPEVVVEDEPEVVVEDEPEVVEEEEPGPAPAAAARPVPAPVRPNLTDAMFRRPSLPESADRASLQSAAPLPARPAPAAPAPTAQAAPAPAETGPATVPPLDALSAVINANIRLPQRRPGASDQPEALTPLLPRRERPAPSEAAPEPAEEALTPQLPRRERPVPKETAPEPAEEAEVVAAEAADEMPVVDEAPLVEPAVAALDPETVAAEALATVSSLPTPAEQAVLDESPVDALNSPTSYQRDAQADDDETPLFRQLRSSWFSSDGGSAWSDGQSDAGWQAAEKVTEAAPSRLTQSGLPVRDPGNRLVPGGMAKPTPTMHRDPEAIRARLAAHAAGVARGRTMATAAASPASGAAPAPTDPAEDVTP
jgi:signal transduction histidine kinase